MIPIRAEITGFDRCEAEGHAVRAAAPVLALCRRVVEAGYDPATPLHAYRGGTLCFASGIREVIGPRLFVYLIGFEAFVPFLIRPLARTGPHRPMNVSYKAHSFSDAMRAS
jgi:hypothetical protein